MIPKYTAACIQSDIIVPDEQDPSSTAKAIEQNLARNMELVDYLFEDPRYGPRLISFSEFCLTGVPESRTIEGYRNFATEIPGWVTEYIGERARKHGCYIACNTFEKDERDWPGHVFNTSFIVGPDGDVVLRYRKNNDSQTAMVRNTNPGDIYTAYVQKYGGPEALFPVIDTEIGRLACLTCFDTTIGEVARCLALRGAEVLIHLTAEATGGPARQAWNFSKSVHAWENACYFLSTNNGDTFQSHRPKHRQGGHSKIIDFKGRVLAEAEVAGESIITATIDIEELREYRASGASPMLTMRYDTILPIYKQYTTYPIDQFADRPNIDRERPMETHRQTLEKMYERGTLVRPAIEERLREEGLVAH